MDIENIEKIAKREFSKLEFFEETHTLKAYDNGHGQVWVEYQSGGPFLQHKYEGFSIAFLQYKNYNTGAIDWVFVPKEARGKGYGKQLIKTAEKILTEIGVESIKLTASGEKKSEFYEKLGYRIIDEEFSVLRKDLAKP